MLRIIPIILTILVLVSPVRAADVADGGVNGEEDKGPFAEFEGKFSEHQKQLMEDFEVWYEKSREAGEKGKDWVLNDIKNIGDWEYLIVTLQAGNEQELSEQLNTYGKDRWEVYWVQKTLQGIQFYFKRRVRTYIKHIPVGDLLHMMPNNQQP